MFHEKWYDGEPSASEFIENAFDAYYAEKGKDLDIAVVIQNEKDLYNVTINNDFPKSFELLKDAYLFKPDLYSVEASKKRAKYFNSGLDKTIVVDGQNTANNLDITMTLQSLF